MYKSNQPRDPRAEGSAFPDVKHEEEARTEAAECYTRTVIMRGHVLL
jgi:hypothetical protein